MALTSAEVLSAIDAAFGDMDYPGDDMIVMEHSGMQEEHAGVLLKLRGRHWRDLTYAMLDELRLAPSVLAPAGYRFYLPAFMRIAVAEFRRADVIPDVIVRTLTPPRPEQRATCADPDEADPNTDAAGAHVAGDVPGQNDEWERFVRAVLGLRGDSVASRVFEERMTGLERDQRNAIRLFLEHMRDAHGDEFVDRDPEIALERYWG